MRASFRGALRSTFRRDKLAAQDSSHLYRRSPYILQWTAGWACLALSFGIDPSGQSAGAFNALTAAGSQFLMVAAGCTGM